MASALVENVDDDEAPGVPRSVSSLKRGDMLKLLDFWGLTESVIKEVSKALTMPRIIPLRAFFKTCQDNALDIVDCSWDNLRSHYASKFQVTLPVEAPADFRSVYIRDWAGRCWQLSQGHSDGAAADDQVATPAKEPLVARDTIATNLETSDKDPSDAIAADEARILNERAEELRILEEKIKKSKDLLSLRQAAEEKILRDSKAKEEFIALRAKLNRELLQVNGELDKPVLSKRAEPPLRRSHAGADNDQLIQRRTTEGDRRPLSRDDLAERNDRYDRDNRSKRGAEDDDRQSSRYEPSHRSGRDGPDSGHQRKKGTGLDTPPPEILEGAESNQMVMVGLIKELGTPEIMSMFGLYRLSEALRFRCLPEPGSGSTGNELIEAMRRESGAGMLQTPAGEIARFLTGHVPPKLLELLRLNPRVNWPLALFTSQNLHKIGTNEGLMVKIQQANGVVSTRSSVGKLIENWETVNDLLEPLRRYAGILSVFDPIYGHILHGLLGVVTRELIYSKVAEKFKPSDINRLRLYVELVRDRFGGVTMNASDIPKFFHYDTALGVEAQYALEDLVRANAKEDAAAGIKPLKGEVEDVKGDKSRTPRKLCWEFNSEKGCPNTNCARLHKCRHCDVSGHSMKDCPKKKKI